MAAIGHDDANALASEVLKTLGEVASISQCTVFAYEFGNRPRTVSVADHRGGRYLRDVADTYARRYYVLDGNQTIVSARDAEKPGSGILLHLQNSEDIKYKYVPPPVAIDQEESRCNWAGCISRDRPALARL